MYRRSNFEVDRFSTLSRLLEVHDLAKVWAEVYLLGLRKENPYHGYYGKPGPGKIDLSVENFVNEQGKGPWDSEAIVSKGGYEKLMQQMVTECQDQCCACAPKTVNWKVQVQAMASHNVNQAMKLE